MTRGQSQVINSWTACIWHAIQLGNDDAAYRLTIGLVRRCRELGLWNDR
jgi:hypothetical protein